MAIYNGQSYIQPNFGLATLGSFGKLLTGLGSAIHAPQLAPGGLGAQLQNIGGQAAYAAPTSNPVTQGTNTPGLDSNIGNVQFGQPIASTGGQGTGGGTGGTIGGNTGGTTGGINTGGTSNNQTDPLADLRNAYNESSSAIQAQGPLLDSAYNTAKGDIQNQLDAEDKTAALQKQTNNQTFGDLLKQNAQTYNEIGQQQRGTFSGLGTLDSSAFQDAQLKNGQNLADNQSKVGIQHQMSDQGIDNALQSFRATGLSKLADLGNQYQQGKLGIAQALANNDLSSANAIQQNLAAIRGQAQQVQQSLLNFGLQAGLMAGYGKDTTSAITNALDSGFAPTLMNAYKNATAQANAIYQLPGSSGLSGQGFIGVGATGKINPLTGQPVT